MSVARPSLLVTKHCRPVLHGKLVHRARLFELLHRGLHCKVTCLVAPAGFGKSALLTEWAAHMTATGWPVAWLALDEADNSVTRWWEYFIAAFEQVQPDFATHLDGIDRRRGDEPDTSFLIAIINAIASFPKQFTLVLDNFHTITNPIIHAELDYLLSYLPANIHLVIAGRSELPLALARLRAQFNVVDINAHDLGFTSAEIDTYFRQIAGITLTATQVNHIAHVTEGWITGLVLAAPTIQRLGSAVEIEQFIAHYRGDNENILNFLTSEALDSLAPDERAFLLQTSILTELNPTLCAAVTGRDDSAEILARLGKANLFLVALNNCNCHYRYQNFFADVLALRRRQAYSLEEINRLHTAACRWHREQNRLLQAVPHALAAGEIDLAAEILEELVATAEDDRGDILPHWLQKIPPVVLDLHPRLRIQWAILNIQHGEIKQAQALLDDAERSLVRLTSTPDGELVDGWRKDIFALRASIQCVVGDFRQSIGAAKLMLESDEYSEAQKRFLEYYLMWAYQSAGDQTFPLDELIRGITSAVENNLVKSCLFMQGALAFLYEQRGELRLAEEVYRQALDVINATGTTDTIFNLIVEAGLAELHREWNDLVTADRLMANAREQFLLYKTGEPCWLHSTRTCLLLAKNSLSNGRLEEAQDHLEIARQRAQRFYPINNLMTTVEAVRVNYWLATDNLNQASVWARNKRIVKSSSGIYPFRRSSEEYSHTERFLLARVALAENQHRDCLQLVAELIPELEANNQGHLLIQAAILKALAHWKLGQRYEAVQTALPILARAEHGNYVRTFVEMHPAMPRLLEAVLDGYDQARHHSDGPLPSKTYLRRLQSACQCAATAAPPRAQRITIVDPGFGLTRREKQILKMLAGDFPYQDISNSLCISLSTTKTHIRNIYSKLGVTKRRHAIERAVDIGLI